MTSSDSARLTAARRTLTPGRRRLGIWRLKSVPSLSLVALLYVLGVGSAVRGEEPAISSLELGFDGTYKVGFWTSARIQLHGPLQGRLVLTADDGDGVPVRYVGQTVYSLAAGESRWVEECLKIGSRSGGILVTVEEVGPTEVTDGEADGGGTDPGRGRSNDRLPVSGPLSGTRWRRRFRAAELPVGLPSTEELCVVSGLRARDLKRRDGRVVVEVAPSRWPTRLEAWEAVDQLVWTASDAEQLAATSEATWVAVDGWLLQGGRMTWSLGRNAETLTQREPSPWTRWVPGRVQGVTTSWQASGLEELTGSTSRLERVEQFEGDSSSDTGALAGLCVLTDVQGRVEVVESGRTQRPLVVRRPYGLGELLFVALDLDLPPVLDWPARGKLLGLLLESGNAGPRADGAAAARTVHVGFQDLSGQLRNALDQFQGARLVPFSVVMTLLVLYLIVVGPVELLVLRRLNRPQLAWWGLGGSVVLSGLLIAYLGRSFQGEQIELNQLEMLDVDLQSGQLRGTTWAHFYSPRSDGYDASLTAPPLAAEDPPGPTRLIWDGLPGSSLGGFEATSRVAAFDQPYTLLTPNRLIGLPVPHASTRALVGRWQGQTRLAAQATLHAEPGRGVLHGQLTNPLDQPLERCTLAFRSWYYQVGTLAPGESLDLDSLRPRNLASRLTGRSITADSRDRRYNPLDTDLPRVAEVMTWHEAIGGGGYTGLMHRYQAHTDLSRLLELEQAVLVAELAEPLSQLQLVPRRDPEQPVQRRRWTYLRLIYPVATRPDGS